ncbi:hypothetical protein THTE_0070 [Thermogutta terrifontis]|uniref:Uncharacterized protein n=1 Tax=Thermogutta terrifontis TaxID=1331910 RepID=A0A286R9P2_9BACT|nr:hypothetical protein THTE_0070 [Thermogutta terrifontis]
MNRIADKITFVHIERIGTLCPALQSFSCDRTISGKAKARSGTSAVRFFDSTDTILASACVSSRANFLYQG